MSTIMSSAFWSSEAISSSLISVRMKPIDCSYLETFLYLRLTSRNLVGRVAG